MHYHLFTNNCTDFVLNVAAVMGLWVPYADGPLSHPQHLADAISIYHELSAVEQEALMEFGGLGLFGSAP